MNEFLRKASARGGAGAVTLIRQYRNQARNNDRSHRDVPAYAATDGLHDFDDLANRDRRSSSLPTAVNTAMTRS